ncbi:DNA-binding PadR family transcriptional regulator [Arthrobacter sp. UYP6]|uniref:PadR family transcriptional regulator n=1 Tax=Arthrobacter sp. UYP6 TaxID=1756378 RepID=UPI003398B5ED
MAARPAEEDEWVQARVESWVDTYKKSMLTPVILRAVSVHQSVTVARVAADVAGDTGWQITERSLYRTLKRLEDAGFLHSAQADAPRTGAKRKEISLTRLGAQFLAGIGANLVSFPSPAPPQEPGQRMN